MIGVLGTVVTIVGVVFFVIRKTGVMDMMPSILSMFRPNADVQDKPQVSSTDRPPSANSDSSTRVSLLRGTDLRDYLDIFSPRNPLTHRMRALKVCQARKNAIPPTPPMVYTLKIHRCNRQIISKFLQPSAFVYSTCIHDRVATFTNILNIHLLLSQPVYRPSCI